MMRKIVMIFLVSISVVLVACGNKEASKKMTGSDKKEQVMTVEVNGQKFEAELYDNDTADTFKKCFR